MFATLRQRRYDHRKHYIIELLLLCMQSMIFVMENSFLFSLLNKTAWRMDAPALFGGFHIAVSLLTAAAALAAALFLARRVKACSRPDRMITRILSAAGWVLVILEIYKQLFLYFIVNCGTYDWWFFPFQLCSVPMYLCILLPSVKGSLRDAFFTFMGGYTFISAAAALVYPEDILRPYAALTVHGFVWHGLLLFISLLILLTGSAGTGARSLLRAAVLFAFLCVIAVLINIAVEPLMQNNDAIPHGWAAMFYMNPYHISPQPLVDSIQKTAGIPAGLILYGMVIAAAGSLVNAFAGIFADTHIQNDVIQ